MSILFRLIEKTLECIICPTELASTGSVTFTMIARFYSIPPKICAVTSPNILYMKWTVT